MTVVFPSVFKNTKVVPVFKKNLSLDYISYLPISLLSNIEKILEKIMYKDCIPFSVTIILSITYSLASDNNILYLIP